MIPVDCYLDAVTEELDRLADLAGATPHLVIPTHPGWRMNDLVHAVVEQCAAWCGELGGASLGGAAHSEVDDRSCLERLTAFGDAFVAALIGATSRPDPEARDEAVAIARRAALTLTVLRSDADRAAGRSGRIETELAVDAVDERLERYCANVEEHGGEEPWSGSMCLVALDTARAWVIEGRHGVAAWRRGRGPAVAAVVGEVSDLALFSWGRRSPDDLAVTGDFRVASSWEAIRT
jgi:hypothetical protein